LYQTVILQKKKGYMNIYEHILYNYIYVYICLCVYIFMYIFMYILCLYIFLYEKLHVLYIKILSAIWCLYLCWKVPIISFLLMQEEEMLSFF